MQGSDLALSKLWAWCPLDHLPTQALWFQQLCLQIWGWALRGWGLGEHVLTLALGNLPWASSPAQHFMQIRISISYTCHFKYWPCISIWLMKTISSNTCSHFSYASPDVWNHKLYPKRETLCVQLVYIATFKKCIFFRVSEYIIFGYIQWHGAKQYFYRKYKCAALIGVCSGPAEMFHNGHPQQAKWGRESAGRVC